MTEIKAFCWFCMNYRDEEQLKNCIKKKHCYNNVKTKYHMEQGTIV